MFYLESGAVRNRAKKLNSGIFLRARINKMLRSLHQRLRDIIQKSGVGWARKLDTRSTGGALCKIIQILQGLSTRFAMSLLCLGTCMITRERDPRGKAARTQASRLGARRAELPRSQSAPSTVGPYLPGQRSHIAKSRRLSGHPGRPYLTCNTNLRRGVPRESARPPPAAYEGQAEDRPLHKRQIEAPRSSTPATQPSRSIFASTL